MPIRIRYRDKPRYRTQQNEYKELIASLVIALKEVSMLFDTFDRTGNAEFPFPKQVVFRAVCNSVDGISSMTIENRDDLASRLDIKTGMSAFSWGEKVSISVTANGTNSAIVSIQSAAKTIFGSATTHGRNRQNVREIINETSRLLTQYGSQWEEEMGLKPNTPQYSSTEYSHRLIADELAKLADLLKQGFLSPEDFSAQKARLLGSDEKNIK
jgi:Short C-terminal domain